VGGMRHEDMVLVTGGIRASNQHKWRMECTSFDHTAYDKHLLILVKAISICHIEKLGRKAFFGFSTLLSFSEILVEFAVYAEINLGFKGTHPTVSLKHSSP
jgi:hypothetical protein